MNLEDITNLQKSIMHFVATWVKEKKTSIPQKEIVLQMQQEGISGFTTVNAIYGLVKKGYIRKAYTGSNKTAYVQLRSI